MRKASLFLPAACAIALSAACDGGGGGTGGATVDSGAGGAPACFEYSTFDGTSLTVSFKADVLPILRLSCGLSSSCHNNEAGPGGQHFYGLPNSAGDMTATQIQAIFDQSLDKPAVAEPAMKIISANKPDQSFLLYKLDGDPEAASQLSCDKLKCIADKSCGTSMPQGGPQLPAEKRDTIRRWIAQGAKND